MSLTSFLGIRDVRKKFREEFPKPPIPWKKDPLAPPRTTNYQLVGTAFDYLLRFFIERINPNAKTSPWVAESVPAFFAPRSLLHKRAKSIISAARMSHAKYLKTGKLNHSLLRNVLLLAGLDPIVRSGRGQEYIGRVNSRDLDDLKALISLADPKSFKGRIEVCLNPSFGEASLLVGGGDADILIDDMLIEIKTTKLMKVRRADYNQLIGYYTLASIGGITGLKPGHKIRKLAIYFSRFGELKVFKVSKIIDSTSFPNLVRWFKKRARREMRNRYNLFLYG